MPKRSHRFSIRCHREGCREYGFWEPANAADAKRVYAEVRDSWKCTRHRSPEEVLSPTNLVRVTRMVAAKSTRYPNLTQLFWGDGSGFTFGDGYKAYADDFPEGTILEITAKVILPPCPSCLLGPHLPDGCNCLSDKCICGKAGAGAAHISQKGK